MDAAARAGASFGCVQLEFGFLLGPADGRYIVRGSASAEAEWVVVVQTLGAPPRRLLERHRRRPRKRRAVEATPVPTSRAGVVLPDPLDGAREADAWLEELRRDRDHLERRVSEAVTVLNRLMSAHRAAAQDPYPPDLHPDRTLVVRVGHGTGDQIAEGRFASVYEVRRPTGRARRAERLSPQERLAALIGGREPMLSSDELVLRARADLEAGRAREAALQARIAIECVLEELTEGLGDLAPQLEADRSAVSAAATTALSARPDEAQLERVEHAVGRMERALRRYRSARS